MRLDKYLASKYTNFSRSYLQKIIKDGKILVNGKIASPHYKIKKDDKITEDIAPPEKIDLSPDKSIRLDVVYEDENYLVINKPAGLIVHPSESVKSGTLVNALLAHHPSIKKIGEKAVNCQMSNVNCRPGIVHRLDKDVSGLMIIAKTQKAFDDLKMQFQNHEIKKEYLALVYGKIKKDEGEINLPIGRSKKGFKMSAYSRPPAKAVDLSDRGRPPTDTAPALAGRQTRGPKTAITRFKVLKRYENRALLKIQTLTGRTHQIRVHLHAIGHPIVGDPIYKTKKTKIIPEFPRLFLHADLLEFHDLNNKIKKFTLPLPKELKNITSKLPQVTTSCHKLQRLN